MAARNHVTIHTALQSVWGVLLAKYNQTDDVVFGSVVSGRDAKVPGIENMVGLFINTIPTRIQAGEHQSFREVLQRVQEGAIESQAYSYLNLSDVQSLSELKRDLIDHVMIFENYALDDKALDQGENDLGFVFHELKGNEATNYGLTVVAVPGEQLILKFAYDENVYSETIIENLGIHLTRLMEQAAEDEHKKIGDLQLLSNEEKDRILSEFNQTETDYPKDKTIQQLFMEQADRTPEQTAVVCGHETLTYRELNERSNQIARLLLQKGVQPETIVGIMADRSPEMIAGIIGILKSGAAYLPIDPEYPERRIKYLLEDSKTNLILTNRDDSLKYNVETVFLNGDFDRYSIENIDVNRNPLKYAYVIYTSGSTGKPKGTMITQKGLVNYIYWANKTYVKGDALDFALYSSISFDLTVTSIFTPLISGNKIVVYGNDENGPLIRKVFKDKKAGIVKLTPSHLSLIKDLDNSSSSIKRLIIGGEDFKSDLALKISESFNHDIEIYNEYGPTEATVGCMIYKYDTQRDKAASIPIGRPADNVQIHIMNDKQEVLPIGVVGELYISGDGLADGYLNKPDLTNERFILNTAGQRMYRTGDLARKLPDRNIEFLGRIDHQVKIRGYRIELGEIEREIEKSGKVKESVVVAKADGDNQYLCAYVTLKNGAEIAEIRNFLSYELPEYMMPSAFVSLEEIPLTTNGKIDITALPDRHEGSDSGNCYEAPSNDLETMLTAIWEEILDIKNISVNTNLFEIGANSLNVMTFVSKLYSKMNFRIPFKDVFQKPTIRSLSVFLENAKNLLKDYTEDCIQLTSSDVSNKKLFCFPPAASLGIAYMGLAEHLERYSVYSFNFIKSENRIKQYVNIIKEYQPEGPYTLIGYSAGGVLAFDVAKELNRQGYEVEDLILIDSTYRTDVEENLLTEEEYKKELYDKFDLATYRDLEKLASDYLIELIMKSYMYIQGTVTDGSIDGNIYYIESVKEKRDENMRLWARATTKKFRLIQGFGTHMEMLSNLNPETLEKNAKIIEEVISFETV
ncbi:amino acid adenylation domain-containing protein [Bacillus sp. SIMBA_033]|uniref:amino acid adenylation domain-containing protein n=2 Tax=Bacteria TaxID=2 RepID=UPI00397CFD74